MRHAIRLLAVVPVLVLIGACATTSSVQNAPLHAGVARNFDADFDTVLRSARESVVDAGLDIENANQIDDETWMLMAKKGTSAFSWGELVRVVVMDDEDGSCTVRVYTERRSSVNLTAKGDYANTILSNIELKLASGAS